ncbi:MAG: hypothetical protein LBT46_08960 [Planctomycetaceae bacterium]|nr:hypothetical protein [Planctomycetaceae bacterium]
MNGLSGSCCTGIGTVNGLTGSCCTGIGTVNGLAGSIGGGVGGVTLAAAGTVNTVLQLGQVVLLPALSSSTLYLLSHCGQENAIVIVA